MFSRKKKGRGFVFLVDFKGGVGGGGGWKRKRGRGKRGEGGEGGGRRGGF